MTTPENTITYHNALCLSPQICINIVVVSLEDNAYAKFWGDKQRALWYVMVFLEWSINEMLLIPEGTYKSRPLD